MVLSHPARGHFLLQPQVTHAAAAASQGRKAAVGLRLRRSFFSSAYLRATWGGALVLAGCLGSSTEGCHQHPHPQSVTVSPALKVVRTSLCCPLCF